MLVSHNSKIGVDRRYIRYFDDDKISMWFAQNCSGVVHHKLVPIPSGIANKRHKNGNVQELDRARRLQTPGRRKHLISYPGVRSREIEARIVSDRYFKSSAWCHKFKRVKRLRYLWNLAEAQFVVCPEGRGGDSHRVWEALYMDAIPVVLHSDRDAMFAGLPVMVVDCWADVTPESLHQFLRDLEHKEIKQERMFVKYWLDRVSQAQTECRRI